MERMTALEELIDRHEIDDLLNRYATALDNNEFDLLETVFTRDAHLSYADAGLVGDYPTVSAAFAQSRPDWRVWLHLVGNRRVELDGDSGACVSTFFCAAVGHDGVTVFTGGEYRDKLTRTTDGWRIAERVEVLLWNCPDAKNAQQA